VPGVFTSIVVGTDGSAPAREAVRVATEMARLCAARLHVVSAYRVFDDMVLVAPGLDEKALGETGTEERVRADIEAMLGGLAQELEAEGVVVTTYASSDNPAQAILDVADCRRADLIVVGNRGTGNPGVLGSVPGNVVHLAPCSVLVVHTWPMRRT
jgi:nucleotide-binding universal stress UspA family protein